MLSLMAFIERCSRRVHQWQGRHETPFIERRSRRVQQGQEELETPSKHCETIESHALPTEILLKIFGYLSGRQLCRCRAVCVRWKQVIDDLDNSGFWREKCQQEHGSVYDQARSKSHPTLPWRSLYKSLCLWSKLESAQEKWSVIDCQIDGDDVHTVHAWKGTAAAHKRDAITYYDPETLERTKNINIGIYLIFEENDHVIAYMHYTDLKMRWFRQLRVVPKVDGKPQFKRIIKLDKVNNFKIFNDDVYYNQFRDDPESTWGQKISEMFVCKVKENLKCIFLNRVTESVWGFSSGGNGLHYLSISEIIFSFVGDEFLMTDDVENKEMRFAKLCKYNLAERANFPSDVMDCDSITGRCRYIDDFILRVHGDIVITGSTDGILRIYHGPSLYLDEHAVPIKEYSLLTQFGRTFTSPSFPSSGEGFINEAEINGIDVMEKENGHVILVSTWKKMMVLSLSHE